MTKWKIDLYTHFGVDLVPFEINNSWIVLDIHSFILNTQTSHFYSIFHGKFEEWGAFFGEVSSLKVFYKHMHTLVYIILFCFNNVNLFAELRNFL